MQDVEIQLPDKVRDVIGRLTGAGFEAYQGAFFQDRRYGHPAWNSDRDMRGRRL